MNAVNLADVLVGVSRRLQNHTAIVSPELTLSYEELIVRAAKSARELRERGVRQGSNVGLATSDSGEAVVLMIAIWMLGATAVPIDFRIRARERAALNDEFDLGVIVEDHEVLGEPGYTSVLVDPSWTDLIARHDGRPLFDHGEEAPALISLTSGTTGRPIGFVFHHDRLLARLIFAHETGIVRLGGRMLSAIPLSYAASRTRVLSRLLNGATIFFHPVLFGAEDFAEAVLSTKATFIFTVPTIVRSLLKEYGERSSPLFVDLQALTCGGAQMSPQDKKQAKAVLSKHFLEGYSSSMSGAISVLHGADMDARPDSVGRVMPFVCLQIVDGNDEPLPLGEAGNIRVRSPAMARSIYRGVAREGGDRIKDGWVYPGDIGTIDREGFLTLLGRSSDLIIRGGANVHPSEVEAALADCPGIREVAVVGFSVPREGEEIAAFVVADDQVTETKLTAHCRSRLSPDKRPRRFVFVSEIPRNASGKVMRAQLREGLEGDGSPSDIGRVL